MKITESQLRKLVKEEIDDMVDEGLFGGLGQLAKRGVEKVKTAGKAMAKTYKAGSLASDLEKAVKLGDILVGRAVKMLDDVPDEQRAMVKKAISGVKSGITQMKKAIAPLKTKEE